ncbi:N2-acetyl-L-ornithine:2-oxoglutarate 5-aminotransferase [Aureococcus anophagefferens]|nr:N2-acetyl-L-ornithine:2-oxoglutarate 5-aminotransferase [Aureococcus anophagefferens]
MALSTTAKLFPGIKRATELVLVKGQGSRVTCSGGRDYLDFTSGIGVTSTGHCHPTVVDAVQRQAATASHLQMSVCYHDRMLELVERLEPFTMGLDSFFFANSGGEAIEGALRLARQATGRSGVIAFQGGYHGRTAGALAVTSSSVGYRGADAGPLPYGSFFAPYPYAHRGISDDFALAQLDLLVKQQVAPSEVAAVLIEPVLGEGGYVPASPDFLRAVRRFCDDHGALYIADEVQCGVGRTGVFYAAERAGAAPAPDILVTAKGLASGCPLSAVVTRADISATQLKGCMGGTYGGNAVACAAAVATLDVFAEERVLDNVAARGAQARAALDELDAALPGVVGDVRAAGLMIGVEFEDGRPGIAGKVTKHCEDRGLLALATGVHQAVRLIPPLTIAEADMAEGLAIFSESVAAAAAGGRERAA